jgi:hypothetical protein
MAILNILQTFGIFYDRFLVHFVFLWYIFSGFGITYQEKSGNTDGRIFSVLVNRPEWRLVVLAQSMVSAQLNNNVAGCNVSNWGPQMVEMVITKEWLERNFAPFFENRGRFY